MADQGSPASSSAAGKRSRGRPLKNSADEEESATRRRARVRKAQQAFQKRRQAATQSLEDRIAAIQNGLEQFGTSFSTFSTAFTQSGAADTHPALLVQLHGLTEQLLAMARIASPESPHESDEAEQSTAGAEAYGAEMLSSTSGAAQMQRVNNSVSPGVEHLFLSDAEPSVSRATSEEDIHVRYTFIDHTREYPLLSPQTLYDNMTPTSSYCSDPSDMQYTKPRPPELAEWSLHSPQICWQGCPCCNTI